MIGFAKQTCARLGNIVFFRRVVMDAKVVNFKSSLAAYTLQYIRYFSKKGCRESCKLPYS
jgi:hypothetical protein